MMFGHGSTVQCMVLIEDKAINRTATAAHRIVLALRVQDFAITNSRLKCRYREIKLELANAETGLSSFSMCGPFSGGLRPQ